MSPNRQYTPPPSGPTMWQRFMANSLEAALATFGVLAGVILVWFLLSPDTAPVTSRTAMLGDWLIASYAVALGSGGAMIGGALMGLPSWRGIVTHRATQPSVRVIDGPMDRWALEFTGLLFTTLGWSLAAALATLASWHTPLVWALYAALAGGFAGRMAGLWEMNKRYRRHRRGETS